MATAKKMTKVTTTETRVVVLELTPDEAQFIVNLIGGHVIGTGTGRRLPIGSSAWRRLKLRESVYKALFFAGIVCEKVDGLEGMVTVA